MMQKQSQKQLQTYEVTWTVEKQFKSVIQAENKEQAHDLWWERLCGMQEPYIVTDMPSDECVGAECIGDDLWFGEVKPVRTVLAKTQEAA